jgi:hypothetical protein
MRSILVLLILVMIGLNGKGQSVTALPDSVLSQCCLEVTLLNGNVTTVDWVFIQYITRDGTGTKLFVEYAPNFGGIQWETQIRIQDDFDEVIERSKFIILPFTVGSTDYGIHRNWIANIEENTTTGGTWIYGRFGTPTKRKFSAVEDYETLKNLLLACRPRAIVVAENGLYTEGDTVRMGGFLIENTTITTEGYNWMMKDTLSKTEFGIDYLTAETGDTTVYWGRRSGSVRQMMQMGNRYWYNTMKDTLGGLFSDLTHSWNAGNPFLKYLIFNPLDPNSGSVQFQIQRDNSFLIMSNETTNPYYTPGWIVTNNSVQIGVNESGSGDPGNGVLMGAFGDGTSNEYLFMITKNVDNNIATNGQFLQLIDDTNGKVEFATIDLSAYLPIADTAAMLSKYIERGDTSLMLTAYIRSAGWGLLKSSYTLRADSSLLATKIFTNRFLLKSDTASMLLRYPSTTGWGFVDNGKTWFADSSKVASRYYTGTNPTTIAANYAAVSNGTNLVARNLFDNNTYAGVISKPWKFGEFTTAGLPTGVTGYHVYETTKNGPAWYQGSRWAYGLESTFNRGTATRVPYFDANGQITESANMNYDGNGLFINGVPFTDPIAAQVVRFGAYGAGSNRAYIQPNASFGALFGLTNGTVTGLVGYITSTSGTGSYVSGSFSNHNYVLRANNTARATFYGAASTDALGVSGNAILSFPDNTSSSFMSYSPNSNQPYFAITNGTVRVFGGHANSTDGAVFGAYSNHQTTFRAGGNVNRLQIATDGTLSQLNTTTGLFLASGTTAQTPTEAGGLIRFNSDSTLYQIYSGGVRSYIATRAYARSVASAAADGNGIISALPIGNVSITTNSNTLTINGSSMTLQNQGGYNQFMIRGSTTYEGTMIYGQRRFYYFSQLDSRSALYGGHYNWKQAIQYNPLNTGIPVEVDIFSLDTVNTTARRQIGNIFGSLKETIQIKVNADVTSTTGLEVLKANSGSTGVLFSITSSSPVFSHKFNADGTIEFDEYGSGTKEAADLSKTQSNYIAGFATDGTVLDLEQKRDTTIYVVDTDYDFSAALTTAQVGRRYNRIIFLMTTTAAAGSDSELTLHTPDSNLMQVEYLVRSTDEAGGFDNKIVFGTNNAVSSTNTLATNYYPAAGQGVGVRIGLRSGVYKYYYY